jgi:hypothetical protein
VRILHLHDEKLSRSRSQSIILLLLVRGEFRVLNAVMLLSLYGAAILAIPLVLNSVLQLSVSFLQVPNEAEFEALLLSIYNHTQSSYFLVVISLFLGFAVTSLVSGISIGRRMKTLETGFTHLGVSSGERNRSLANAFLLVSLVSLALAFAFAFVFASIALYSFSLFLHGPYLTPTLNLSFWIYLVMIPFVSFVALITGWFRVKNS